MMNHGGDGPAATNLRRDPFKTSVGKGAGQRRRQAAITIGKDRRDSVVRAKRLRRADPADHGDGDAMQLAAVAADDDVAYKLLEDSTAAAVLNLKNIGKKATPKKVEALQTLRRLLSCSAYPPVHVAVQAGVVPLLVDCLGFGASEDQLFEAAWCLTNIASGDPEQTRAVEPALPLLILHLGEKNPARVVEQCAWALGNVAGEAEDLRDWLLRQGALSALARNLSSPIITLVRTAAWALSNLIKGPNSRAATELMKMDGIVDTLVRLVSNGDDELVVEVAWVLVYVTSMSDLHSSQLIHAGLLPPLVARLAVSHHQPLLTPVLRTIGNIVASDNSKCDAVLAAGQSLPGGINGALARILETEHRTLQKEAAWVVSNLAAGSILHKRAVFNGGAVSPLLYLLATSTFDVRKEAAYALGNLCVAPRDQGEEGKPILEHLNVLVDRGCLMGFIALVKSPDLESARLGLQFLELVMRALPDGKGPKLVEKLDGIAAMEELQFHANEELRIMSNMLIDQYFGEDYGLEEEFVSGDARTQYGPEYPPWRRGGLAA
ncbi:importin subunit alpha-9 [Physcomitrium patens]|uniref:Importin subunit alpha n=1 Tax=Physcomitrium patens TaxID=3218 RepID=A0A2K1J1Y0_PHYPA|nr:importin subunit alpha-9-like [Physcomitrium patens]PNR35530.1 hypothetical protein PHYPA_023430 [Physcomitrium patens]|eukprot:XP_024402317.1 importin subunit alpha-9-like [Physcomitrella patens]